nr:MAG TPA: hypothetical protein [Caudoviricetes sp.]
MKMQSLHVVVFDKFSDINESLAMRLFSSQEKLCVLFDLGDFKVPEKIICNKDIRIYKVDDEVILFVRYDLPSKMIGMLEYQIYLHTGMRGDNISISSLEVFKTPHTQLKKYLTRKL